MKNKTRTAIIVVAYHGKRWIPDCVASVDETMERREHLYVVDNSGNQGCIPETVNHCHYTVLKTDRPLGFAEANNFALRRLQSPVDYVCFLNQDTLCRPGWLERCVDVMDEDRSIGAVTPVLSSFGWQEPNFNFRACAQANSSLMDDLNRAEPSRDSHIVQEIPAAAMVVRSAVLWQTGAFDPIFGSYYEDFDLCRRIREAGSSIGVCVKSHVAHYDSVTDEDLNDARTRNRHMLILRNRAILKIRSSQDHRLAACASCFGLYLPKHLIRSVLRMRGRKSVRSVAGAMLSLLRLTPRLLSQPVDSRLWQTEVDEFREQFVVPDAVPAALPQTMNR
jgi:GT2 family glycosyltransferase